MKKCVILLIFCLSVFGLGQNVSVIRKQVEVINNSKNYVVKKISNDYFVDVKNEVTDNGQELEGYYDKNELQKIVHFVGLSNWNIITEFYFNKMDLIFVLKKKYQIVNEKGYLSNPKLISESKVYFVKGKIIKKIEGNNDDEFSDFVKLSEDYKSDLKIYK